MTDSKIRPTPAPTRSESATVGLLFVRLLVQHRRSVMMVAILWSLIEREGWRGEEEWGDVVVVV